MNERQQNEGQQSMSQGRSRSRGPSSNRSDRSDRPESSPHRVSREGKDWLHASRAVQIFIPIDTQSANVVEDTDGRRVCGTIAGDALLLVDYRPDVVKLVTEIEYARNIRARVLLESSQDNTTFRMLDRDVQGLEEKLQALYSGPAVAVQIANDPRRRRVIRIREMDEEWRTKAMPARRLRILSMDLPVVETDQVSLSAHREENGAAYGLLILTDDNSRIVALAVSDRHTTVTCRGTVVVEAWVDKVFQPRVYFVQAAFGSDGEILRFDFPQPAGLPVRVDSFSAPPPAVEPPDDKIVALQPTG